MTLQVRVGAPAEYTERIVQLASASEGTSDIALYRNASLRPPGDVVIIHSARESTGELLEALEDLDLPRVGSITLIAPELVLSDAAEEAKKRVPGDEADVVIWDLVTNQTGEEAKLSWTFLVFIVIATQLAGIGIVTNSTIAIVGAMVVGPEFGPLAALSLALVERRFGLARTALLTLVVGFISAMAVTAVAAAASVPLGLVPRDLLAHGESAADFIYHPGPYSLIVALLAGAVGMMSMIGRKSAALVGVFISVTTVPAAGFVSVALVLGEAQKAFESGIQLAVNLAGIVLSAVAVLLIYRWIERGPLMRRGRRPTGRS